jgi:KTSC domain
MEHFTPNPKTTSQILRARYDPVSAMMIIEFKDADGKYQSSYEYGSRESTGKKVTRQDWEDFRSASRPGEFFAHRIKGVFSYRKLNVAEQETPSGPEQESLF